jgi:hypothetical protein
MTSTEYDPTADGLSTRHIKHYVPYPERERTIIPPRRVKWWVWLVWGAAIAVVFALAFVRPGIDGQGW